METIQTNPETKNNNEKESSCMRRTYSAFRNNQSRVTALKDKVFDMSQEINLLK